MTHQRRSRQMRGTGHRPAHRRASPSLLQSFAEAQQETQGYITAQITLIASMQPNTPDHRTATRILVLLQDGLHLLAETKSLVARERPSCRDANTGQGRPDF